jgi:hypothetical protein
MSTALVQSPSLVLNQSEILSQLNDVWTGLLLVESAMSVAASGDTSQAPFPLCGNQANIYVAAQKSAYQHVLEMCSAATLSTWMQTLHSPPPDDAVALAKLKDVHQGLVVADAALKRSSSGDLTQAIFPLVGQEAEIHLSGTSAAYQYALEMCNFSALSKFLSIRTA